MTMLSPTALPDSVCGTIPPLPIMGDGDGDEHFPPLLRRYRLGLALFITAVAMIFVSFSSAYIVRRGIPTYESSTGVYSQTWEPLRLPLSLLLLNTCLLISASLTMEMARRRIVLSGRVKKVPASFWVRASLSVSIAFIVGQGFAWQSLWSAGRILRTGARTAFFYVLTGTHAACLAWRSCACVDSNAYAALAHAKSAHGHRSCGLVSALDDCAMGLHLLFFAFCVTLRLPR